jgi:hypothetical protein
VFQLYSGVSFRRLTSRNEFTAFPNVCNLSLLLCFLTEFRWLSRKYGKIVMPVIEEFPVKVPSASGIEGEFDEMVRLFPSRLVPTE